MRPNVLERAIARLRDDRFRVRFMIGRRYERHDVIVISDLYLRPSGDLLYGTSRTSRRPVLGEGVRRAP